MDFFDKKIKTLFNRHDVKENGKIEAQDFDDFAEYFIEDGIITNNLKILICNFIFKISQGNLNDTQATTLRITMKSIWEQFYLPADADNDSCITVEELTDFMRSAVGDISKRPLIINGLELIFQAIDSNNDKAISPNEFHKWFLNIGVDDPKFTQFVFDEMDSNGDGELTLTGTKDNLNLCF